MPNTVETKLTVKTDEGVANVNKLADATEALSKRSVKAAEAQVRATQASTRATQELIKQQQIANQAAGFGEKAAAAGKAATAAIGEAEKAVHSFSLANAGAAREMLVLFHEGITGNFKRAAGSLLVLGERTGAAGAIFRALLGPVGAAAAAIGTFAVAAEEGYKSSEDFRRAMILTGGAAGVTEGQFRAMAQSIASETGRSVGTAKEALQQLVASGQVAPQNIAKMGTAIVQIAHLTGESSSEVAKQFEDMATDVVGWIQRHKQYADSLTSSQVETIRQLQKMGDIQGAVGVALDAINQKTADSAGFWTRLGTSAANAWEKLTHAIGGNTTAEDKLATIDARIAAVQARMAQIKTHPELRDAGDADNGANLALYQQQRAAQAAVTNAGQQAAAQRGVEQATQNAGKAARAHLDQMLEETKGADALKEALHKLQGEFDAAAKAGTPMTDEQQKELRAKVVKAHRDPNDKKEESAYASTLKGLVDEKAKLDALTESYIRNGRAADDSREAVLRARFNDKADPLFGRGNSGQGATLLAAASAADQSAAAQRDAEHLSAVEKQVKAYGDLVSAKEANAREAYIEDQLGAHSLALSEQTTQSLVVQGLKLRDMAGKRYDQGQADSEAKDLAKRKVSIDEEVDAINRQNDALKQTTLQREVAADVAKLQKAAEEELLKPYADSVAIQAQLADGIERVTAARVKQYNGARDPQTQAARAAGNWAEGATDAGAAAAKMTTSSLDSISAAIEKMTRTGQLSFKDLWKSMADEFLTQIIRMQVAKLAAGAGSLWGSVFSVLSGSSSGSTSPDADSGSVNLFAGALDGARATGGNVNAGGSYLVGENGPELFNPSGSGSITPNDALGGAGGMVVHVGQGQVINVGQGVSRAEVAQAVTQANSATIKQVQRLASTGKLRTS